ncbi:hypothetical protein ATANTOWER_018804 [Ataeniobius toweri]|uniref:Uncharacterized protein n=1 Tax=Ataeniobius toweri TaxID=208326 RepID=A0ABU7CAL9_9TELE|nr:hypothetical protein [Ataeniobius toweri]
MFGSFANRDLISPPPRDRNNRTTTTIVSKRRPATCTGTIYFMSLQFPDNVRKSLREVSSKLNGSELNNFPALDVRTKQSIDCPIEENLLLLSIIYKKIFQNYHTTLRTDSARKLISISFGWSQFFYRLHLVWLAAVC